MRPNLAKLTLARKLATLALMLWKREEEYDPTKNRPNRSSTRRKGRLWVRVTFAAHRQSVLATKKVRGCSILSSAGRLDVHGQTPNPRICPLGVTKRSHWPGSHN